MPGRHVLLPAVFFCIFCFGLVFSTTEAPVGRGSDAQSGPPLMMTRSPVEAGPTAPRRTDALSVTGVAPLAALPAPAPVESVAAPAGPAGSTTAEPAEDECPQTYTATALVTGYCPCRRCCGRFANGRTSTGTSAWKPGVAADPDILPYGTVVEVPGYGTHMVDDTGIAMRRSWRRRGRLHIDLRFTYHYQARNWGVRYLRVRITPPAETPAGR